MGKLECICGNILSDTCGCDAEAFTEEQMDVEEKYDVGDGRSILECENCGALAIEDPLRTAFVKFYLPENEKFNRLFTKRLKDANDGN